MPTPRTAEVWRKIMETRLQDLHTAFPGEVISFDATAQTVVVQPLIKSVIDTVENRHLVETYPQLRDVPVCWPRAQGFILTFPLAAGDMVTILCHEADLGNYLETGTEGSPVLLERHGLSGAVVLPLGPYPYSDTIGETIDGLVLGKDGGAVIRIKDDGTIKIGVSGSTMQPVALADDVKGELDAVKADLDSLKTALVAHVHPGVTSGGASTLVSTSFASWTPHTPAEVGSSIAEVEE